jgi:hypothetical protein
VSCCCLGRGLHFGLGLWFLMQVADLRNVTQFSVVNLVNPHMRYMHVQMERLKDDPLWKRLTK